MRSRRVIGKPLFFSSRKAVEKPSSSRQAAVKRLSRNASAASSCQNGAFVDPTLETHMNLNLAPATYGADRSGLVCGFRFAPDKPGIALDADSAAEWLDEVAKAPDANAGEFLWLHFNLAHVSSERWMRTHLDLPESFFEAFREGSHSTRIEHQYGALLAVVNDVMYDFEQTPSDISTLWVYTHERIMVTARLKQLRSVDRLRASVRNGESFDTAAELLIHLLRDQADLLVEIVRRTSIEVDRIEDHFLSLRAYESRRDLGAMRRVLVRLQRLLAPEPGSIFRLLVRPPAWLSPADVQSLRDSTEEFSLVLGDLSGLAERIKLLQEEIAARLNEQTNRTLFTLTIVTVLALPINIIAGLFGMNVGGIPLAENKHGFWMMVLLVVSFTLLAGWWGFRRRMPR
ncbi:Mg2+/Co2+ transporter [Paraburkholderia piptadeniae]|uniref:Mg2+/Co2+ transporter n=2 Tax=Paraburkholderia piptadeniae TaxID=1701573 RepID=A0A1N7RSC9_9BURK|nr:Mg2+/Co2+ transporter [Paraburkholderia piptadeniae]